MEAVEPGSDAVEVADAIAVAVGETAWINFVENGVLPPGVPFGIGRFLLG